MSRTKKQETIIYLIIIGVILLIPVMVALYNAAIDAAAFTWQGILRMWLSFLPFFLLFAIHNWLLCPLALKGKKLWYFVGTGALLLALAGYLMLRPKPEHGGITGPGPNPRMEMPGPGPDARPRMGAGPDGAAPMLAPQGPEPGRPGPGSDAQNRPLGPLSPGILLFILGVSLIGGNWAVKSYFLESGRRERLEKLEKENLDFQLAYLRYQINPHFFMNTLNNIHALVDLDPEKAKESIVELSKLMRYILYEGSKPTIPLEKETEFLRQYVSLMRMRYADSVRIDVSLPDAVPGAEVPPLVFVSFVENAFKHGVSYERPSFIRVNMSVDSGKLVFQCTNSRHTGAAGTPGGVGMENVRKRLELLYGDRFLLHVDEQDDTYDILVMLPIHSDHD